MVQEVMLLLLVTGAALCPLSALAQTIAPASEIGSSLLATAEALSATALPSEALPVPIVEIASNPTFSQFVPPLQIVEGEDANVGMQNPDVVGIPVPIMDAPQALPAPSTQTLTWNGDAPPVEFEAIRAALSAHLASAPEPWFPVTDAFTHAMKARFSSGAAPMEGPSVVLAPGGHVAFPPQEGDGGVSAMLGNATNWQQTGSFCSTKGFGGWADPADPHCFYFCLGFQGWGLRFCCAWNACYRTPQFFFPLGSCGTCSSPPPPR
jgi:hypothetical protein